MNCNDTRPLIHAYIDKELDAANGFAVEKHLQQCPQCQLELEQFQHLQHQLRQSSLRQFAPEELKRRILGQLQQPNIPTATERRSLNRYLGKAVAFAASVVLGFVLIHFIVEQHNEKQLITAVVSGHTHAINANRLTDIADSRAETLSAWFTGKLDFSPRIYNFSADGFRLIGARLDALEHKRVASLTYRSQHHIINLYTWPSPDVDDAAQESHQVQGYELVYWCQNKMNYWIVSDLDKSSLQHFARLIQQRIN